MEIGKPAPFSGELVEMGRLETLGAKTADIAVSLIVGENDDDIGWPVLGVEWGARGDHGSDGEQRATVDLHHRPPGRLLIMES
jgi:hypothetical protein